MFMQDAAGDFEVYQYNATLNAFVGNSMGTVGAPWAVDGIAAATPGGGASSASTAQLCRRRHRSARPEPQTSHLFLAPGSLNKRGGRS